MPACVVLSEMRALFDQQKEACSRQRTPMMADGIDGSDAAVEASTNAVDDVQSTPARSSVTRQPR